MDPETQPLVQDMRSCADVMKELSPCCKPIMCDLQGKDKNAHDLCAHACSSIASYTSSLFEKSPARRGRQCT